MRICARVGTLGVLLLTRYCPALRICWKHILHVDIVHAVTSVTLIPFYLRGRYKGSDTRI